MRGKGGRGVAEDTDCGLGPAIKSHPSRRIPDNAARRGAARHGTARHGSSTLAARRRTGGRIDQRPRRGLPACCDPSFTVPDNYHRHHRHYYYSDSITRRLLLPAVLLLRGFARSFGKLFLGRQSRHLSSSYSSLTSSLSSSASPELAFFRSSLWLG